MGENLRLRTFVVLALTALSAWLIGKPLLIDGQSPLVLGLDIRGGVSLRYEFDEKTLPPGTNLAETVKTAEQIYGNRLDALGVRELSIRAIGTSQVEVSVPGITLDEADSIQKTLESLGRLELRLGAYAEVGVNPTDERERLSNELKKKTTAGEEITVRTDFSSLTENLKLEGSGVTYRWMPKSKKMLGDEALKRGRSKDDVRWDTTDSWELVRFDPREGQYFAGEHFAENGVFPELDSQSGKTAVGFQIRAGRPAQQFADWTERNKGQSIVTLLDNEVQSLAVINERIEGRGIIRGGADGFTPDEINRLISVIKSGSLNTKPILAQKFVQGPSLGEASIQRGLWATALSFALVAVFMVVYYRMNGVIAVASLLANLLLLVGAMAWLDATLTLPGIAGLILTIGMAVDANILISERIREELDKGKTIPQAVKNGFDRAYTTIFDANLTTFITGFFLYQFGTGTIRGFAVSLMIGLATSMVTGVYFSRTFFEWLLAKGVKSMTMMRMMANPNFAFLKHSKKAYAVSAAVILGGCTLFFFEDQKKFGMDFTGGFEVQVALREPMTQQDALAVVRQRFDNPDVVSVGSASDGKATRFQIKIKQTDLDAAQSGATASPAATGTGSAAETFAAQVGELFGARLVEDGIQELVLAPPDELGRVAVTCKLRFEAPVARTAVEAALKRNVSIDALEGPETSDTFALRGRFARNPGDVELARGMLAARIVVADGREVTLANPMPAKSYIGPRAGKELRDSAIRAMFMSLIMIIVYARLRFRQYSYGIAAVAALIHDVLVTLGGIAIARAVGLEIEVDLTVVAAFLTIIGYSINDTIVIFDRIRENLPRSSLPLDQLIDRSVNQTLSRSILTSLTVFLSVLILFLFNVGQRNALEGFSFAMIIGVITGSYSTIYVASPLVAHLEQWAAKRKGRGGPPAAASAS
ncbi:MAG: protein translocase subunit SecD [Planctomycetes bacterium]|nr:protein translocase subunit SecD [Planctomycetota bacterium]